MQINQEVYQFIQSIQTDRVVLLGVHDQALASQIKHKETITLKQGNSKRRLRKKGEKLVKLFSWLSVKAVYMRMPILKIWPFLGKTCHRATHPGTVAFISHDTVGFISYKNKVITS